MKNIEFSNFRRFANLGPLAFGKVTLLSGGNNSGKSTIVKAAILAVSYLKSKKTDNQHAESLLLDNSSKKFFFDIDNTHISSFKRALNNNCDVKYDNIIFGIGLGDFDFNITVKASEYESNAYGFVSILKMLDNEVGIEYMFDFDNATMTISFLNDQSEEVMENRESIEERITEIQAEINNSTDLEIISNLNMKLLENRKQLEVLSKNIVVDEPSFVFTIDSPEEHNDLYAVASHIRDFIGIAKVKSANKKEEKSQKVGKEYILSKEGEIVNSINRLTNELNYTEIEFIGAHAASQEAVLSIKDNTYPAITIHEFCKSGIGRRVKEDTIVIGHRKDAPKAEAFIVDMMKKFSIGSSAEIHIHNNEAYEFYVIDGKFRGFGPLATAKS